MWIAVLIVSLLALIAGFILAVVSVAFAIEEDPLVTQLRQALPGANCGACSFSGCDGYAAAMAHGEAKPGLCTPGGEATLAATSALLGQEGSLSRRVAVVRCAGCEEAAPAPFVYRGIASCRAAMQLYGGDHPCTYGCLGYGDCLSVCSVSAITLKDGIAHIDPALCAGCGQCATTCPKQVIALLPLSSRSCSADAAHADERTAVVLCTSHAKGVTVRSVCSAGCIGCRKCTTVCEANAITVDRFLATVDPSRCTGCGRCQEVCPAGCIHSLFSA